MLNKGFIPLVKLVSMLIVTSFQGVFAAQWQMPVAHDVNHFQTQLAVSFAQQVRTSTEGKISIEPVAQGKLFRGEQILGAVKNNLAAIGLRLMSAQDHDDLLFQLDALPFLAKNYREAFKLYKASKPEIEKVLQAKGVKFLYAIPWPAQGLYSRVEIKSVEDLRGLSYRPYSKLTQSFGEKLGLKPLIMPANELAKVIKKKQLDVLFGSALAAQSAKFADYFGYWYELQAWLPKSMMVMNLKRWESLTKQEREALTAAARKIESRGWVKSKQISEQAKLQLSNAGVSVEHFNSSVQRQFEVLGLGVVDQWLLNIGDKGRYVLERYMSLSNKPPSKKSKLQ